MNDRCQAVTSRGTDCKNNAAEGSQFCGIHSNWEIKTEEEKQEPAVEPAHSTLVETGGDTYQVDLLAHSPEFQKFEVAKRIARTLAASNLVPEAYRGRSNDCFVAINMGAEVGLEPFAAIQSIAVIDGKPCLYGDGLIGVVRASSKCEWIKETLDETTMIATCEAKRKGDPNVVKATYSLKDAKLAGIDTKFNWKKHPKRMLQMRARAYCLRDAFPDLLKGLGVVEEMYDHENTPPPIQQFELPETPKQALPDPVTGPVTLAEVERAMHQSDSMADLLKAAEMAKALSETDQGTARITYKKMRKALWEDEQAAQGDQ